jgi:hypothetical protein
MLALVIFVLLVVAVAVASWRSRDAPARLRCCNPGAWPPTDIAARGGEPQHPSLTPRRHDVHRLHEEVTGR